MNLSFFKKKRGSCSHLLW